MIFCMEFILAKGYLPLTGRQVEDEYKKYRSGLRDFSRQLSLEDFASVLVVKTQDPDFVFRRAEFVWHFLSQGQETASLDRFLRFSFLVRPLASRHNAVSLYHVLVADKTALDKSQFLLYVQHLEATWDAIQYAPTEVKDLVHRAASKAAIWMIEIPRLVYSEMFLGKDGIYIICDTFICLQHTVCLLMLLAC